MSSMMCGMLLGAGVSAKKTYVDDVFSTFLYEGTSSSHTINNGIDLSGEGGMTWIKNRGSSNNHNLFDTVRGVTKYLRSNENTGETTNSNALSAFNNNGFSVVDANEVNASSNTYASWTFRKAPGFFDVVTWTGNGTAGRTISHSLACIPGCIMIKAYSHNGLNWAVGHRSLNQGGAAWDYMLKLNNTDAEADDAEIFNDTAPTATNFTVGDSNLTNTSGVTYVAYLFAGGESTQNEAVSVDFDGSGSSDQLIVPSSSDYAFGSGDFTVEGWMYGDNISTVGGIVGNWDHSNNQRSWLFRVASNDLEFYVSTDGSSNTKIEADVEKQQWFHFAGVRTGNTIKLFINGIEKASASISGSLYGGDTDPIYIGSQQVDPNNQTSLFFDGKISNIRVTKGQALYTSSFRVPTEPLTTTSQGATASNVKLLCCNNSSITGATVIATGSITNNGSPTASSDSPFDDPAGFAFGDSEEGIIKSGSYVGNGSSDGPEINLGWEPSWILLKNATTSNRDWKIVDAMRGIVTGGDDASLRPNESNAEDDESVIDLTPTGFKLTASNAHYNENGETIIYCALRRPDGYVGKPPELGNQVFTPVYGSANAPLFKANNHVVDFTLQKNSNFATQATDWNATARLMSGQRLIPNTTSAQISNQYQVFDYQSGTSSYTGGSGIRFAWMWKRHAGFDVVTYEGNGVAGRQIPHSLNGVPEMMWVKNRDSTEDWMVYHSGLYDGYGPTNSPQNYMIRLNLNNGVADTSTAWNDTAPTATHFTLGNRDDVNKISEDHIAILYRSVTGISKIGTYTGNHEARTITTGFQPRFLIIKGQGTGSNNEWVVFDTTRGWASGVDNYLVLNDDSAQTNALDAGQPTSTGFTLTGGDDYRRWNDYGVRYIYYAHA